MELTYVAPPGGCVPGSGKVECQEQDTETTPFATQTLTIILATDTPTPANIRVVSCTNTVLDNGGLNLRNQPGVSSSSIILTTIPADTTVEITGQQIIEGNQWYQVDYDGQTGWVAGTFGEQQYLLSNEERTTCLVNQVNDYNMMTTIADGGELETNLRLDLLRLELESKPYIQEILATECQSALTETLLSRCREDKLNDLVVEFQNLFNLNIIGAANEHGVPSWLLKMILIRESQLNPYQGTNSVGAVGIAQIVPDQWYGDLGYRDALTLETALDANCSLGEEGCSRIFEFSEKTVQDSIEQAANILSISNEWINSQISDNSDISCAAYANNTGTLDPIQQELRDNCLNAVQLNNLQNGLSNLSEEDRWEITAAIYNGGIGTIRIAMLQTARQGGTIFQFDAIQPQIVASARSEITQYVNSVRDGTLVGR